MALLPSDPLPPSRTRWLVGTMVFLILALSVVATVMITQGWGNEDVQSQVEQQETERRTQMPRLGDS